MAKKSTRNFRKLAKAAGLDNDRANKLPTGDAPDTEVALTLALFRVGVTDEEELQGYVASIMAALTGEVEEAETPAESDDPSVKDLIAALAKQRQQPIVVQMERRPEEMTAPELLQLLAADPTNEEAYDALLAKDQYIRAASKDSDRAVLLTEAGTLDAVNTPAYWQYLRRGRPVRMFKGQRTASLDQALGRTEKELHHPLFAGEIIFMGLDAWSQDWSGVNRMLMEAIYWARNTGHELFPPNPDPVNAYEEIAAAELPDRYQDILDDYQQYLSDGNPPVTIIVVSGGGTAHSGTGFRQAASAPQGRREFTPPRDRRFG